MPPTPSRPLPIPAAGVVRQRPRDGAAWSGSGGPTSPAALLAAVVFLVWALPAAGQLRPLDPVDWTALDGSARTAEVGGGLYLGQRASLAGTEGRLLEVGSFAAAWSAGRVALRLAGTALRLFEDRSSWAGPVAGARDFDPSRRRVDSGDYRLSTLVALTRPGAEWAALVRFGVRLPTTDNGQGLERDRTDFFASLAGRTLQGPVALTAEAGIGVLGTRDPEREQVDPLLFAVGASWRTGEVRPFLALLGQHDTRPGRDLRGVENLGEARLGVRVGGRRWVQVAALRGWTRMGPDLGVELRLGTRF